MLHFVPTSVDRVISDTLVGLCLLARNRMGMDSAFLNQATSFSMVGDGLKIRNSTGPFRALQLANCACKRNTIPGLKLDYLRVRGLAKPSDRGAALYQSFFSFCNEDPLADSWCC
jgi:hypothetical protein